MADVRLFAALRDAAGTSRTAVDAGDLVTLLADLRRRYGEPFTSRLARSTVVVAGEPTSADDPVPLEPDTEVVLLPPFSGG